MLVYYIDAFNLIHRLPPLRDASSPHQALLRYMRANSLTGSSANRVTVVFDGHPVAGLDSCGYEIVFSFSSPADDIIKQRVGAMKNSRQAVVVSDDRAIRDCVRRLGAEVLRLDEFIRRRKRRAAGAEEEKEIGYNLAREINEEMKEIWGIE